MLMAISKRAPVMGLSCVNPSSESSSGPAAAPQRTQHLRAKIATPRDGNHLEQSASDSMSGSNTPRHPKIWCSDDAIEQVVERCTTPSTTHSVELDVDDVALGERCSTAPAYKLVAIPACQVRGSVRPVAIAVTRLEAAARVRAERIEEQILMDQRCRVRSPAPDMQPIITPAITRTLRSARLGRTAGQRLSLSFAVRWEHPHHAGGSGLDSRFLWRPRRTSRHRHVDDDRTPSLSRPR